MENSSAVPKAGESGESVLQSQRFPSPPKHKKDFYLASNTFITEGDNKTATKGNPKVMGGFPNSHYINETYGEIGTVLDTLNQRIKSVVDSNQDVFISAYKDSMNKMNDELRELKYKMSADKIKEKLEQKLKLVEKERDWFRDEALRLNRKCKKLEEKLK